MPLTNSTPAIGYRQVKLTKVELKIWNDFYLFLLKTMLKVYKEMKIEATGKDSIFNFVFRTVIIFHLT